MKTTLIDTFCLLFFCLISCAFTNTVQAGEQPSVIVQSYGKHVGGNIVYTYQVTNRGPERLFAFSIGCNCQEGVPHDDRPELVFFPLDYDFDTGVPASSYTAPSSWSGTVEQYEEIGYISFEFDSYGTSVSLLPGYTATFSITTPKKSPDEGWLYAKRPEGAAYFYDKNRRGYLSGHYSYRTGALGKSTIVSFPIQLIDNTPPTLSIKLNPAVLWPPNDKPVPVTATIIVKDDYDPEPEIKLESITANETLDANDIQDAQFATDDRSFYLAAKRAGNNMAGRIYTITYSATDASGNKATASATVTVPHDQGK